MSAIGKTLAKFGKRVSGVAKPKDIKAEGLKAAKTLGKAAKALDTKRKADAVTVKPSEPKTVLSKPDGAAPTITPPPVNVAYDLNANGKPTAQWAHYACTYQHKALTRVLYLKWGLKNLDALFEKLVREAMLKEGIKA